MCLLGERGEEGVVGEKKMCSPLCFSVCSGKTELCDFSVNYPLRGSRRGHNTHNPVGGGGFSFGGAQAQEGSSSSGVKDLEVTRDKPVKFNTRRPEDVCGGMSRV